MSVQQHSAALFAQATPGWWRALWSRRGGRFAEIRSLMLSQLEALPDSAARAALAARITHAQQPQILWTLRRDLMSALVETHGEMLARRRLTDITFMFAGLLDGQHQPGAAAAGEATAEDRRIDGARGLVRTAAQMRSDH